MLPISVVIGSDDYNLFLDVIIQGIDARLEGFTNSAFKEVGSRLYLTFVDSEYQILLRRLWELSDEDENASQWESDIVECLYGIEII